MRKVLYALVVFFLLLSQACSSIPEVTSDELVNEELKNARARLSELQESNATLQRELNEARAHVSSIESQMSEASSKFSKQSSEYTNLKAQLETREGQLQELEKKVQSGVEQQRIYQAQLDEVNSRYQENAVSLQQKEEEYAAISARYEQEKLLNASVVFNTPKKMYVGESAEVTLQIAVNKALEEAVRDFRDAYGGDSSEEDIQQKETKLGQVIVASLRASTGITVRSLSGLSDDTNGRRLDLKNPQNNLWNWEIVAEAEGEQWIRVSLYYETVGEEGNNEAQSYGTWRSDTIDVAVKTTDSVSSFFDKYIMPNIEFLWGAILLPLGAIIGARWKGRSGQGNAT